MRAGVAARATREVVWITALFLALTLALCYPLSLHPGSTVLPLGGDTRLYLWTLEWDVHALTHRPWAVFDANIFAPEHLTLAYSENCLGSALIAAPVLWLSGNAVLAMNVVVLLSCVLCGIGMYLLARELGVSRAGSLLAGLIFAFAPPRFLRLGQLHLAPVQWMPFCLAYLHRYFAGSRSRDLKIAVGLFALQVMTSGHAGLILIVAILCLVAWRAIRREPLRLASLPRDLGVAGGAGLALVVLLMLPYERVQREQSWVRTIEEAQVWSPNAASFLESPSHVHRFIRSFLPPLSGRPKAALFPGVIPLLLALGGVWAVVCHPRMREQAGAYLVILVLSVWLALGPDYGLYTIVHKLPAWNLIRVPSRYVTLSLLALAILAAHGFDAMLGVMRSSRRSLVAAAMAVLLVAEFAVAPLDAVHYESEIPAADRWLAGRPKPFVVAEVPVLSSRDEARASSRQSIYMMHSTAHWQKTVHGYSGFEPPRHTALYRALTSFPDGTSLEQLEQLGVNYVVVHTTYYPQDEWAQTRARLATYSSRLRLLYNDGQSRVYVLNTPGG
jgi:hypothetical protein